ncbi:DUF7576 family protein [Halobaculum gomorrense]|uniref:Uncharacterized protein n=1 Tax=Halobaculum gomorrense TaxID=43928 RepID=A0A1M5UWP6_9EURY|nr:hypothetical protein [Halobaculum gomorrense]SHH67421.1 hypothetical protein SAMN05443636_3152 [Halobaculum gomorrense]
MTLREFVGRCHPNGNATVAHAATHYRWSPGSRTRSRCPNCGTELELSERHVLVALSGEIGGDDRYHLCDEACVAAWLGTE